LLLHSVSVGYGITQALSGTILVLAGATSAASGYIKGIITGIGVSSIDVKF
jgi:hypothetical protein